MLTLRPGSMGGSEAYARALARALARRGRLDYLCLVPPEARDAAGGLPPVSITGVRGSAASRLIGLGAAELRGRSLRRRLPGLRGAHDPFTIPAPALGVPAAITLHDLLHREVQGPGWRRLRAFRLVAYDRPARRATLVIVPSDYVRERAIGALGLDPDRVRTIHHGVDHDRFRPGEEEREPFLLYPARQWWHKNHARLFDAFRLLRRERPELELVLTGWDGGHGVLPEGVRALGLVSDDELASLYRRAAALVFPSLHEGFGLPPLEAMASGCPVAVSRSGSLPEVCGGAAVYFDPRSAEDIADGIGRTLEAGNELGSRGIARAEGFTWERSAEAHEAVYRELLGG